MKAKKRILFIINPVSGVGRQKKVERAVEEWLDKDKFDYRIAYTTYAHEATSISIAAVLRGFDIVVAVGGDGSINDCVKGLLSTGVALAIVPTGSGNGLARCLNIPLSIENAIKVINNCRIADIDTIRLNGTLYASIAGVGFDALIAREFAKTKVRGFQPYAKLTLQHYPQYRQRNYILSIDGKHIERQALFVSFANSNQFGFNTEIAPNASLNDGLMDVVVVRKPPLPMLPWMAQSLFFHSFDKSTYVEIFQARHVILYNNAPMGVNLDGEYVEYTSDLEFRVEPKSLRVITP